MFRVCKQVHSESQPFWGVHSTKCENAAVFATQVPPIHPSSPADPPTRRDVELNTLIPRKRTQTFDVRRGIHVTPPFIIFHRLSPRYYCYDTALSSSFTAMHRGTAVL